MSDNHETTKSERKSYARPTLKRLGRFEDLTKTSGANQVQADQTNYTFPPTVS